MNGSPPTPRICAADPGHLRSICFNARGGNGCKPNCGYNDSVDYEPGLLVATQMKQRAAQSKPKFVLNAGMPEAAAVRNWRKCHEMHFNVKKYLQRMDGNGRVIIVRKVVISSKKL